MDIISFLLENKVRPKLNQIKKNKTRVIFRGVAIEL